MHLEEETKIRITSLYIEITEGAEILTSTKGSQAAVLVSEGVALAIPAGGPRKLSQTSRSLDSSASLQSIDTHYAH